MQPSEGRSILAWVHRLKSGLPNGLHSPTENHRKVAQRAGFSISSNCHFEKEKKKTKERGEGEDKGSDRKASICTLLAKA